MQIISIEQLHDGHATRTGLVAAGTYAGALAGRYTIIVDDDINPFDLDDVLWAVCTRSQPTDVDIIKRAWTTMDDPIAHKSGKGWHNSRAIIYAVKPFDQLDEFAPVNIQPQSMRKAMFEKWKLTFGDRWQTV